MGLDMSLLRIQVPDLLGELWGDLAMSSDTQESILGV